MSFSQKDWGPPGKRSVHTASQCCKLVNAVPRSSA